MARLRFAAGRRRLVVVAVLVLAGLVALPLAANAHGQRTPAAAAKNCAPAPSPARPDAGIPGMLYQRPASAAKERDYSDITETLATVEQDPFAAGSSTTIAEVYGYGYRWQNYDNGCLPGSSTAASMGTGVGNVLLGSAASVNALTHSEFNLVISPTWLSGLDKAVENATKAVRQGFFGPWFTPVVLVLVCMLLWAASRADISKTVTTLGWAGLVLVTTTYVMSYPVASAQAIDGIVQSAVTTAARGQLPDALPPRPADYVPPEMGGSQESAAQYAINQQFDVVDRNTLYRAWLEGTLGSSTSKVALDYGPDLFKASHLSWQEAALVDAGNGAAIISQKKDLWVATAAKVHEADDAAYQQLTGNKGRWDGAVIALFSVASTLTFLVVAGFVVVVSYLAVRVLIPLAPALGVFGMLKALSGWMMSIVRKVAVLVGLGPLFFAAALVNLLIVTAVIGQGVLGIIISVLVPLVLFSLLHPRGAQTIRQVARRGRRRLGRTHRTRRDERRNRRDDRSRRGRRGRDDGQTSDDAPVYARTPPREKRQQPTRRGRQPVSKQRRQQRVAGRRPIGQQPQRTTPGRETADPQTGPRTTRRQRVRTSEARKPQTGPRTTQRPPKTERTGRSTDSTPASGKNESKRKAAQSRQKRKVAAAASKLAAQVVVEMARSKKGKTK